MTLIEGQGWQLWNEILPRWENFAEMLKTAATGFSHAAAAGNLFLGIYSSIPFLVMFTTEQIDSLNFDL